MGLSRHKKQITRNRGVRFLEGHVEKNGRRGRVGISRRRPRIHGKTCLLEGKKTKKERRRETFVFYVPVGASGPQVRGPPIPTRGKGQNGVEEVTDNSTHDRVSSQGLKKTRLTIRSRWKSVQTNGKGKTTEKNGIVPESSRQKKKNTEAKGKGEKMISQRKKKTVLSRRGPYKKRQGPELRGGGGGGAHSESSLTQLSVREENVLSSAVLCEA